MADGFDIHLEGDLATRLRAAAAASGVNPSEFLVQLLDGALPGDSAEDADRLAEYDRTGEFLSAGEWIDGLRQAVSARGVS